MLTKTSTLLALGLLTAAVIAPIAVAHHTAPESHPPGASRGQPEADDAGRGPGPGPTSEPRPKEGPRARECSVPGLLLDLPIERLDRRERKDLAFVREEEKLARDVYLSIAEAWSSRVFRKIARIEKKHVSAILVLYAKYELNDAASNGIGVFERGELQELYEELVRLGSLSRIDAYKVGALVEEMSIHDLSTRALANANNEDLKVLYQNLSKGSRNHLRTFDRLLEARGVAYEPEILSRQDYDEIVTSPAEKGLVDADGDWICGGSKKGHFE